MMKHKRTRSGGFTLLEVLIAMIIMGIGLTGLLRLYGVVCSSNIYSQHITASVALAEKQIERLNSGMQGPLTNGAFTDANNPVDVEGNPGGKYTRSWTISDFGGYPDVKQVSVSITWGDGSNSTSMTSLVHSTL